MDVLLFKTDNSIEGGFNRADTDNRFVDIAGAKRFVPCRLLFSWALNHDGQRAWVLHGAQNRLAAVRG